jgi:hypothetical protein
METLLKKIEAYGFECEAGSLQNCEDWQRLRTSIAELERRNAELARLLVTAKHRIDDLLANDDGHAHKEAKRFLPKIDAALAQAGKEQLHNKHGDSDDYCPECFQSGCNGECMGDGLMGD